LAKGAKVLRVADDLVSSLRRRARRQGLTLEALVNRWIRERLQKVG
jgi:predicted HicB family RNase H-like nuclease